jgi:glycosyltransferase involved in cell wall biosynthesis
MKKIKLSVVILTKNEEKNIIRCLNSLNFCRQVVIVDDYSEDKTVELIEYKKYPFEINIFKRKLDNDFAAARNFGMEKAGGEWILFIDADEEVTKELADEIKETVDQNNSEFVAYYIKRRDFFWGRELRFGETKKVRNNGIIRLVKRNSGRWFGKVHEEFKVQSSHAKRDSASREKFKVGIFKNYLNHYPHQKIDSFLRKINFYSTLRAKELFKQGKKFSLLELIFYPSFKFILTYFTYLGFLDGSAGFVYSFMMSFHSFLVRAKLFQYERTAN